MEAIKSGQLILAGRTQEPGDKTLGIAIFRASDEAAARAFVKADPLISAGLMTADLHPFALALENANPQPRNAESVYLRAKTRATFVRRQEVDERG